MINLEDRFYTYVNENYSECQEREILAFVKDVCQQVLELAAENANMIGETQHNNGAPDVYKDFVYVVDDNGPDYGYAVNKQSILDTINQVK